MKFLNILICLIFSFTALIADANSEFIEAVKDGNLDKVNIFIRTKVNLNASDSREMTPLLFASADNSFEIVKALVEAGADINRKHKETGKTALMYASANGHIEVIRYILSRPGIVINAKDKEGKTALIHSVFNARKDVIRILLDNKANPNTRTNSDESALSFALKGGRPEVVNILRQAGARD